MDDSQKPSQKQINMLAYVIRSSGWTDHLPKAITDGVDERWMVLRDWAEDKLTRYQLGSLINFLEDDELPEDWRVNLMTEYFAYKQHPNFKS